MHRTVVLYLLASSVGSAVAEDPNALSPHRPDGELSDSTSTITVQRTSTSRVDTSTTTRSSHRLPPVAGPQDLAPYATGATTLVTQGPPVFSTGPISSEMPFPTIRTTGLPSRESGMPQISPNPPADKNNPPSSPSSRKPPFSEFSEVTSFFHLTSATPGQDFEVCVNEFETVLCTRTDPAVVTSRSLGTTTSPSLSSTSPPLLTTSVTSTSTSPSSTTLVPSWTTASPSSATTSAVHFPAHLSDVAPGLSPAASVEATPASKPVVPSGETWSLREFSTQMTSLTPPTEMSSVFSFSTIPGLTFAPITTPPPDERTTQANAEVETITTSSNNPTIVIPLSTTPTATVSLARVSAALESCITAPGGLRPDGAIDRGCGEFFSHVIRCFQQNGPWADPYKQTQSDAYRSCVCMSTDSNPFTEYAAFFKNYTGCAACLLGTGYHILPFTIDAYLDIRGFCRSQEPNAFLFTQELRQWVMKLGGVLNLDVAPLEDLDGDMAVLGAEFTGTPGLANVAWGASAPPEGQFAEVTPVVSVTTVELVGSTRGVETVTSLVSWAPTKAGETWDSDAADSRETAAATSLLESALCVGKGPCAINGASTLRSPNWLNWVLVFTVAAVLAGLLGLI